MNNTLPQTPVVFQPLLFSDETKEELSRCCVFPLSEQYKLLATAIMVIEPLLPLSLDSLRPDRVFGRKPHPMHAFFRFQIAMPVFCQVKILGISITKSRMSPRKIPGFYHLCLNWH
ncbi:MAG: hypothetical protein WBI82_09295 [Sphaerochaeta sp.]